MATVQQMLHCRSCGRKTMHLSTKPSHLLHLFLSILTVGLWLIVWAIAGLTAGRPACSECGTTAGLFQFHR